MTSGICGHCEKFVEKKIESHHLIPRWCGGTDEDIIEVCHSCHAKLERIFENFIKWGQFTPVYWENKIKTAKMSREYYIKNKERILKRMRERYKEITKDPNYWKDYYQKRLVREPDFNKKKVECNRIRRRNMR